MHLMLVLAALVQQPDTTRLPDVVVTASRIGSLPGGAFAAHTIITRADLAERGEPQLLDALRDVPGLVVVQAGSRGAQASIFLRGGESDFVKLLVDGVAINTPGGWVNLANVSTANIERIEVVRGPGSVLHGSDAMTGVIQVFTRHGAGPLRPRFELDAGSRGTRRAAVGVAGAGRAGSASLEANGFRTDGNYAFNSGYRHEEVSGRVEPALAPDWRAVVTFRVGFSRAEFPTDGSGTPTDRNQYTTEDQGIGGVEVVRQLGGGVSLQGTGSLARTVEGFRNAMDDPADTVGYGFIASSDSWTTRTGADLRVLGLAAGPLSGTAGIHYEDERQRRVGFATSDFGFGAFTDEEAFRANRSTRAGYGEAALQAHSAVTLLGMARVDHNSAFGTLASWRLGATVRGPAALVVHGQAGRAFKAPTFSELFARTAFEVGNAGLRPEVAHSWEVGVRRQFHDGRLEMRAAGFGQRFDDLIQYAGAEPGEPTYSNVGRATSRGLELGLEWTVLPTLTLSASGTRLWTRVVENGGSESVALSEGASLVRRPAFSAASTLRWSPAPGRVLRLGGHVLGARDDIDFSTFPAARVRLPARVLLDLSLTAPLPALAGRVGAVLRIENLLDTRWEQALGFPGRPRQLQLGLRSGG